MRNNFLVVFLSLWAVVTCFGQTGSVKGIVLNSSTAEPLPFASVYINFTTLATSADKNGEFILRDIPYGKHELIVSFVGHHPHQIKINIKDSIDKSLEIRLRPKEMRPVLIQAKRDKKWRSDLEKFKILFLGDNVHAAGCEILNPWILDFDKDDDGFFTAGASDILKVENYSLGYTLFYEIKNFRVGSTSYTINGNVRFKQMEASDTITQKIWLENRQSVYLGSSRHLLKSIVDKRVAEEGFELYQDNTGTPDIVRVNQFLKNIGREISEFNIVNLETNNNGTEYKMKFPRRLEVHYLSKSDRQNIYRNVNHSVSWIETRNNFLSFDGKGILHNMSDMIVLGTMSKARISELLPFDFEPLETNATMAHRGSSKEEQPTNFLAYLLEKPYLHTDKSYYYPNEEMWFRCYMNYSSPVYKDSLSQVLHVDLADASKKVVMTKIFPIIDGRVQGNLTIPSSIAGGDYLLRAYTRWMLNFDQSFIFTKPVKLLEYSEIGLGIDYHPPDFDSAKSVAIELKKDTFDVREQIVITLGVKDLLGNFIPADFSVSVTDLKQAVVAENEMNILTAFSLPTSSLPDSVSEKTGFQIEYGVDLKGRLVTKKGKLDKGFVTLRQENAAQVFISATDANGAFSFRNVLVYDSVKMLVMAKTFMGKQRRVILDTSSYSPPVNTVEPLKIQVVRAENPSRYNLSVRISDAIMLREVIIKESRIEPNRTSIGVPDVTVSGESLRAIHATDILQVLQSKIPGLRVINGMIRMSGPTSYGDGRPSNIEPLVLVDGIAINPTSDLSESLVSRLSSLSPQEIERIEVSKFAGAGAFGSRGANGVISITTRKTSSPRRSAEGDHFVPINISGFPTPKKFRSPDYGAFTEVNSRPDYRSTIYWNPFVATGKKNKAVVSFYTADIPTGYRIVVEGKTTDGKIARGEKIITVQSLGKN